MKAWSTRPTEEAMSTVEGTLRSLGAAEVRGAFVARLRARTLASMRSLVHGALPSAL